MTLPGNSDSEFIRIDGEKREIAAQLGLEAPDIYRDAHSTFAANLNAHVADGKSVTQATKMAIADLYLAGILWGRRLMIDETMRGSSQ